MFVLYTPTRPRACLLAIRNLLQIAGLADGQRRYRESSASITRTQLRDSSGAVSSRPYNYAHFARTMQASLQRRQQPSNKCYSINLGAIFFTALRYPRPVYAVVVSLRPSAFPSQVEILPRRLNVGSRKQRLTIALDV